MTGAVKTYGKLSMINAYASIKRLLSLGLAFIICSFSICSTASAQNELKLGKLKVGKVLFLGNSITLHGPAPEIGWNGNWGMAASSQDKDFVHLLIARINKEVGGKVQVKIRNIADFERRLTDFNIEQDLKEELAFTADVVILAIGENSAIPKSDQDRQRMSQALNNLLAQLKKQSQPKIFVRSQFWPDAEKDKLLKRACEDASASWVDLEQLGADPANSARSERKIEHAGVAGHPGDRGMTAIADKIWAALTAQ